MCTQLQYIRPTYGRHVSIHSTTKAKALKKRCVLKSSASNENIRTAHVTSFHSLRSM